MKERAVMKEHSVMLKGQQIGRPAQIANPASMKEQSPGKKYNSGVQFWIIRGSVILAFIALWAAVTYLGNVPAIALPTPGLVAQELWITLIHGYQGSTLIEHGYMSLWRITVGFVSAAVIGVLIGFAMSASKVAYHIFDPVIQFLRPIPPLIYIPLLQVWFGIGELPKTILIFICALPFVVIGTYSGIRSTKENMIRMAQCFGASRAQLFRYVILPSALPEIMTSIRLALGMGWTCVVAAEMIAASSGLGWIALMAGQQLQTEIIFVGVICIALLGFGMDLLLRVLEKKLVHWQGKT